MLWGAEKKSENEKQCIKTRTVKTETGKLIVFFIVSHKVSAHLTL